MKIYHLGDVHYCARYLAHVDNAVAQAIQGMRTDAPDVIVLAGDTFDAEVSAHEPAYQAAVARIAQMLDIAPVLILQGTFSHDRPGVLTPLLHLRGRFPIHVAERIHQVALVGNQWIPSDGWAFAAAPDRAAVIFSCLPSQNRAQFRISKPDGSLMETIGDLMLGWSSINCAARRNSIPTVVVSHGTVTGSVTETKSAMVSQDHEFSCGSLFSAEASAVLLAHIHAHQFWEMGTRKIAYCGSTTKLIYGHKGVTGALLWEVNADGASFVQVPLPARELIDLDFPGPPDMARIAEAARSCAGAYIRLRYTIDEENRHLVDPAQLRELLVAGGAEEVKIEPRINPVVRTRASGIHETVSIADKVRRWCELTNTPPEPLVQRLAVLEAGQQPGVGA